VAECIHGFDEGLCDICYPRRAATAPGPRSARAATGPRASRPAGRSGGSRPSSPADPSAPPLTLATQRAFHFTHLRNLEAIVVDGALRAAAAPELDLSSPTVRALRAETEADRGRSVAEYVAFHASPQATRWREVRDGAPGPHWSDAARRLRPSEFVVLVAPAAALGDELVATDGDAAAPASRFAVGPDAATALLRRVRHADPQLADVELLAPDAVPLSGIALIGVPNEPVRDRVRAMLAEDGRAGPAPKIAVYPPWFAPS